MIRRLRYAWAVLFGSARYVPPEYHLSSQLAYVVGVPAFTIWRHVFIERGVVPPNMQAHEEEHVRQYARLGVLRFLLLYWFYQLRDGYEYNPMEREAQAAARRVSA